MARQPHPFALLSVSLAVLSAASACSFAKFDELEERAPVIRAEQSGSIRSTVFGQLLLGIEQGSADGGRLVVAGTGENPAINTLSFGPNGALRSSQSSSEAYADDLRLEGLVPRGLTPAPSAEPLQGSEGQQLPGPFVYIGANDSDSGRVVVADVVEFAAAGAVEPSVEQLEVQPREFGAAVSGARFTRGAGEREDLVVGGRGRIWLFQAKTWPRQWTERSLADVGEGWPSQNDDNSVFRAVAAGNLDASDGDEVVVAAPDAGYVAILTDVAACLADEDRCEGNLRRLEPGGGATPQGTAFGRALLVTDLDGDGEAELLVGAPDAPSGGAVYVFDRAAVAGGAPRRIAAPSGARGFGRALAFGRVDGTDKRLLAIGAPGTSVGEGDGTSDAGKVYLYERTDLTRPKAEIALKTPAEGDQLGAALTTMAFRSGSASADLLVSGAPDAAIVFFSNTTEEHEDLRQF